MKPLQANSEAELILDEPRALPVMHSDEAKVAQILRNLISNALKFTETGEVRVAATTDGAGRVVFTVRDTGIGLSTEDQTRIFEEFEQVAGHLQARSKGTGLGLPLSRRLAHLLGGDLTVESAPGEGSTFTLSIPADLRTSQPARRQVLVVDDEEAFRYALHQMVGPQYEVLEAADGLAALELIRTHRPALIFLDLNMPRLDGFGLLERLDQDEDARVVVSTSKELSEQDRARLARADYIVSKDQLTRESVSALLAGAAA